MNYIEAMSEFFIKQKELIGLIYNIRSDITSNVKYKDQGAGKDEDRSQYFINIIENLKRDIDNGKNKQYYEQQQKYLNDGNLTAKYLEIWNTIFFAKYVHHCS